MSITITLLLQDEEHIILIESGDDLIGILKNTLGDLNNYIFSINGEKTTRNNDPSKRLYNNMIIDVKTYVRGLLGLVIGPRGYPLEIKSLENLNRPIINIETVHISCMFF